ncbi:conserved Plasmodium protein, unknown function [Plasmodium ovale]|uniref:HTH OST-type domain-containing protein n=2 Tax=Plasmodium ovale TaxID=36330 RepID=A0A1A8W727_PLAOA|nr:conserved Plasmodium protein, unknown function [Plasmodium ovale curtisi]SBS97626.1 conserved Plasmodium protein, unknown function [Plasmodium ovale curtisi]SCP06215.1 conserved Plasmodium protein, unknown function [Plasmodium ovale]
MKKIISTVNNNFSAKCASKTKNKEEKKIDIKNNYEVTDTTDNFSYINRYLTAIFDLEKSEDSSSSKGEKARGTNGSDKYSETISRFHTKNNNLNVQWKLDNTHEFETMDNENYKNISSSLQKTLDVEEDHDLTHRSKEFYDRNNFKLKKAYTNFGLDNHNIFENKEMLNHFYSFNENDHAKFWHTKTNEKHIKFSKNFEENSINGKQCKVGKMIDDEVFKKDFSSEGSDTNALRNILTSLYEKSEEQRREGENSKNVGLQCGNNMDVVKNVDLEKTRHNEKDEANKNLFLIHDNLTGENICNHAHGDGDRCGVKDNNNNDEILKETLNMGKEEKRLADKKKAIPTYSEGDFQAFVSQNSRELDKIEYENIFNIYANNRRVDSEFACSKEGSLLNDNSSKVYLNRSKYSKENFSAILENAEMGKENPLPPHSFVGNLSNNRKNGNNPETGHGVYAHSNYGQEKMNDEHYVYSSDTINVNRIKRQHEGDRQSEGISLDREIQACKYNVNSTNLYEHNLRNKNGTLNEGYLGAHGDSVENSVRNYHLKVYQMLSQRQKEDEANKNNYILNNNLPFSKPPPYYESKMRVDESNHISSPNDGNIKSSTNSHLYQNLLAYLNNQAEKDAIYNMSNEIAKWSNENAAYYQGNVEGYTLNGVEKGDDNRGGNYQHIQSMHNDMNAYVKCEGDVEGAIEHSYRQNCYDENVLKLKELERGVILRENNPSSGENYLKCTPNSFVTPNANNQTFTQKDVHKGIFEERNNNDNDFYNIGDNNGGSNGSNNVSNNGGSNNKRVLLESLKSKIRFILENENDEELMSEYIMGSLNEYNKSRYLRSGRHNVDNYEQVFKMVEQISENGNKKSFSKNGGMKSNAGNSNARDYSGGGKLMNYNFNSVNGKVEESECDHTFPLPYNKSEAAHYGNVEENFSREINFNNAILESISNLYNKNRNFNINDLRLFLKNNMEINKVEAAYINRNSISNEKVEYYLRNCEESGKVAKAEDSHFPQEFVSTLRGNNNNNGSNDKSSKHWSGIDNNRGSFFSQSMGATNEKGNVHSPSIEYLKMKTSENKMFANNRKNVSYNNEMDVSYNSINANENNDLFRKKDIHQFLIPEEYAKEEEQYEKANDPLYLLSQHKFTSGIDEYEKNPMHNGFQISGIVPNKRTSKNDGNDSGLILEHFKKEAGYQSRVAEGYAKQKYKSERFSDSPQNDNNLYYKCKSAVNNKQDDQSGNFEKGYFKNKESNWGGRKFNREEERDEVGEEGNTEKREDKYYPWGKKGRSLFSKKKTQVGTVNGSGDCTGDCSGYGKDSRSGNCDDSGNDEDNPIWNRNARTNRSSNRTVNRASNRTSNRTLCYKRDDAKRGSNSNGSVNPKLRGIHPVPNMRIRKKSSEVIEFTEEELKRIITKEDERNLEKLLQSLYDDRILPQIVNVKGRAEEFFFTDSLKNNLKKVYGLYPEKYIIKSSNENVTNYIVYFLKKQVGESYFFCANNLKDIYDPKMWEEFKKYLDEIANSEDENLYTFSGGRYGMAKELQRRKLPFFKGRYLGELCHIVHLSTNRKMLAYENNYLKPISQCHKYTNAKLGIVSADENNAEICIRTMDELKFYMNKLLKYYKGGFNISTLKKKLKSKFNKQLCESVFHCIKLIEVLQLDELKDVCVVDADLKMVKCTREPS